MKDTAKLKGLPPVYTGKWATASDAEVQAELEKGTPFTYRFRVPKEGSLSIDDLIRGEVSNSTVLIKHRWKYLAITIILLILIPNLS